MRPYTVSASLPQVAGRLALTAQGVPEAILGFALLAQTVPEFLVNLILLAQAFRGPGRGLRHSRRAFHGWRETLYRWRKLFAGLGIVCTNGARLSETSVEICASSAKVAILFGESKNLVYICAITKN